MRKIAVIGAGTMGNGIAHVIAQNDIPVSLIDVNGDALETAIATISKNLDRQISKEKISEKDKENTLGNITTFTVLEEGIDACEMVIEAATENIELKLNIFRKLDELCSKDTILATNTSSISITRLAAATQRPGEIIGMHFMNPVPVMKLVEIIRGYRTSDDVTRRVF